MNQTTKDILQASWAPALAALIMWAIGKFWGIHWTADDMNIAVPGLVVVLQIFPKIAQFFLRFLRWKGWIPPTILLVLFTCSTANAQVGDLTRIVVQQKVVDIEHEQFDENGESMGVGWVETSSVPSMYFATMVTVSVVRINLLRRDDYRAGAIPGVGYGFHWSPKWYNAKGDEPLLSIGVFLEGGLQVSGDRDAANYAVFTVLPAVTVMKWFSVGVGYEGRISLTPGVKDDGAPMLAIGIASTF